MKCRITFNTQRDVNPANLTKEFEHVYKGVTQLENDLRAFRRAFPENTTWGRGEFRYGSVAVVAGSNNIVFDPRQGGKMSMDTYVMTMPYLKITNTINGNITINSRTKEGFTCYCSDSGTLYYACWL